ncbi:MAG: T9SS type A sorting domain-containing protein, partial [Candidatus Kapaibacterium sp.]
QSDIIDRTTWLPTVVPSDMKNIPLVTLQTADKGVTIREKLYDSQMRLATSSADNFDLYKQYLTVSNFTVADLPTWNGLTQVSVSEDAGDLVGLVASPNPSNEELTVSFDNVGGPSVVSISNTVGQTLYTTTIEELGRVYKTIPTANLSVGAYLLTVRTAQGMVSKNVTVLR